FAVGKTCEVMTDVRRDLAYVEHWVQAFPADYPHLTDCHCRRLHGEYRRIHRAFQQTARFVLGTTAVQPIVTAAVYRVFGSKLPRDCSHMTSPFNLPAPGRRQPLYVVFDLAETCVFVKQSRSAFRCGPLGL